MKKILVLIVLVSVLCSTGGVLAMWSYADGIPDPFHSALIKHMLFEWKELPSEQVSISDQFMKILNNEVKATVTINGTVYTSSYDALTAAFNNPDYGATLTLHNNSYIGTMQPDGTRDTGDIEALRALFGKVLTTQESTYSLMLKRDAIDGRNETGVTYLITDDHGWYTGGKQFMPGAEMIIFSTNDDLSQPTGTKITVYATVLTREPLTDSKGNYIKKTSVKNNRTYYHYYDTSTGEEYTSTRSNLSYPVYEYGNWYNLYEDGLLAGEATIAPYASGSEAGSFDTGTWRSTVKYGSARVGSTLATVISAIT